MRQTHRLHQVRYRQLGLSKAKVRKAAKDFCATAAKSLAKELAKAAPMYALEIQGQRYDAGDKLGFLIATVEFALKNPALGADFGEYLVSRAHVLSNDRRK